MKNIFNIVLLAISTNAFSQVIIGDQIGTATDKTSVLLEFAKTENRGLILPYATTIPNNPTEGTILLDASNSTTAKIKYFNGTSWINLNTTDGDISNTITSQSNTIVEASKGVILGKTDSTANGVLILESTDKALILPTIDSTDQIINPAPGMIAYLTPEKLLAVFNGSYWEFWSKP